MEKGKIKLHKSGKVKKFTKEDGKGASVPSIFDFSQLVPTEGTKEHECEYELDTKGNVSKIIIHGKQVPFKVDKLKEKEAKQKRDDENKKAEKMQRQEQKENKHLINLYKNDFVDMGKTYLPADTIKSLSKNEWKVDNFSLRLNKLARFEEDKKNPSKSKFYFFKTDRGKVIYKPKYKFSQAFISEICNKNLEAAENLIGTENLKNENLKINWRMAVGLGHESVYETSITLHHIYGIPYIPASSIKGVVRSYIINEYFTEETEEPAEYWALRDESFCKVFGTAKETKVENKDKKKFKLQSPLLKNGKPTEHIGSIIFFDAFPTEEPNIEPDIMNVHYKDYYGKENVPPTDYQDLNPIFFLTVKDTKFQFVIGAKKEKLDNFKIDDKTIDVWLKEALENHGIGAKTAVGYGRMQ